VKRARVSYGALFESGYDIFAGEDGTVQGKGRKRTRFSRESGTWRYSSLPQSPEPTQADEDMVDSGFLEPDEEHKPVMTDEGCQTLGLEDDNATEALADLPGQQAFAVISEDSLGIHEVRATGFTGGLDRSEASIDMRPPPIPHVPVDDGTQEQTAKQQASTRNADNVRGSTQNDPVPPNTQPGTSPLERSDPVMNETTQPSTTDEVEDFYGLSPTADGHSRHATPGADVDLMASSHDDMQLTSDNNHYELLHALEERQNAITYPKLPSRSTSPDKILDSTSQVYPEPDVDVNYDVAAQSGPYFGEQFQTYPDIDGDHLDEQSEGHWDMHTENVRSPNRISLAEHKIPHEMPIQKLLARHLSPGGIAMSRSQSGHSEMIDLTEDSDGEIQVPAGGSQKDDGEEASEQFSLNGRVEDQSDDEEGYENLLYDDDRSESGENEFNYDDEDNMRHPIKHLAPGEVADDDEEEDFEDDELEEEEFEDDEMEEEGSYDDEDASDGEAASTAVKQPQSDEPEVIDLLSSDEEDEEDDDACGDPSEENAATRMNESNSMFIEEEESDAKAESDVENSEGEVIKDGYAEEDPPNEPQLIPFEELAKPTTMEDLEESIEGPTSEEDEIEDADEIDGYANSQDILSSAANAAGHFQGIQFDSMKGSSAPEGQFCGYEGHDGASDGPDHLLVATRESEKEGTTAAVNGNDLSMSGDVIYPILPAVDVAGEDRPQRQEKNAQNEDASGISRNDQLPTPDASQVTVVVAPDTSFGSTNSFQLLSDRIDSRKSVISEVQNPSLQEPTEGVEDVISQAPLTGSAIDAPVEAATDATIGAVEIAADGAARGDEDNASRDVSGNAVTDAATEIIPGDAPEAASNAAADVVEKTMVKTIQPAPITPRRSKRLSFSQQHKQAAERSPSINMDEPTTPDDYDASVELAMAALDSPSKQDPDEKQISDKQLRVMLSRPLHTDLGDFTTLKLVRFNLEKKLDVLAVVTTLPSEPQRAKAGLRHYHLRFNVTDATIAPSGVVVVNIFRPYKTALPTIQPGECVLLRNFLVKSEKGAGFTLRSDDGSSWVVFKNGGEEEVRGPPVEYGDGERDHVSFFKAWYRNLDTNSLQRLEKANGDKGSDIGRNMAKVF
jgi:hypothetical protein